MRQSDTNKSQRPDIKQKKKKMVAEKFLQYQ